MRQVATLIVAALVLAAPLASAKEPLTPRTVFGIVWQNRQTFLVELDARTLAPVSRTVPLGTGAAYLGRSIGNGMRAAFSVGKNGGDAIRFVDLSKMRPEHRVAMPCSIGREILWGYANRLVTTCGDVAASVLIVDPVKQRIVGRKLLTGTLVQVQARNGWLVGLLAPLDGIGTARLLVVDENGFTRTVPLPAVRAGTQVLDANTYRAHVERPAVAIEPGGRRVAVIPATGSITIVDLGTLRVSTQAVRTVAAARKNIDGAERNATWTWTNTIAVSGTDWTADGESDHSMPAGLTLVDTVSWTSRLASPLGTWTASTGPAGVVLQSGTAWDGSKPVGSGLSGFSADGAQRFHLFGTEPVLIATVAGTYVYVADNTFTHFQVVDTTTGTVIGTPTTAKPTTLAPTGPTY